MADTKLSGLTASTAPDGRHRVYGVNQTPTSESIYLGDLNLLPNGYMVNGSFSVTVSSNNLTFALKTASGADPSATDPVSIWMNGSFRRCTGGLSKTLNAGTDYFLSGSRFPAVERDYFLYAIWNTTPATDILDLGISPLPFGRVFSNFSTTAANEKYIAWSNASTPTSTDAVVPIGRFAATLSAAASYNWSVPTYTNTNFVRGPITETRWLSWTPTFTGFSVVPPGTHKYKIHDSTVFVIVDETGGTSNATGFTMTLPFTPITNIIFPLRYIDNTTIGTTYGVIAASTATANLYTTPPGGGWTGSNSKYVQCRFFFDLV